MEHKKQTLGKEAALALAASKWWENRSDREIAEFQMLTTELCVPFDRFHEALEKSWERPVYTHELGLNWDGITAEFFGDKEAPSMDDILELIPKEKRVIVLS